MMKNLILLILVGISLTACTNPDNTSKWEYKIVRLTEGDGESLQEYTQRLTNRMMGKYGVESLVPIPFNDPTTKLNELGEQGWELVNVYTTTETVFPNFGDANYHTGIKGNIRTQTINYVFKRPLKASLDKNTSKTSQENDSTGFAVEEVVEEYVK